MKMTFDEVLERLADERQVLPEDVQARALLRRVWIAEWHLPGCLSESSSVCRTKEEAIETALMYAEGSGKDEFGPPRGMKTALEKTGFFQHKTGLYGYVNTTVEAHRLRDIL